MKPIFKLAFIYVLLCITYNSLTAQNIGINGTGGNAHPSALLDIDAVATPSLGVLIPRIALQAVNIAAPVSSPATSLLLYNTASASSGTNAVSPGYYYWDGNKWVRFNTGATASAGWDLLGNAGTTAGTNFIGTTDAVDWVIKTSNLERMRVLSNGNVGIGTSLPSAKFHLFGGDGIIADNTQANFSVNRTAQTLYLDNLKSWSDNGLRLYDGNTNGHIHIGNAGISYLQSYAQTSIAAGILGTSALDFDDNANFSNMSLNPLGGNVGIGITVPAEKLDVLGNIQAKSNPLQSSMLSADGGVELFRDPTSSSPQISGFVDLKSNSTDDYRNRLYYNNVTNSFGIFTSTTGLGTGATERFTILNSNGNVGIGTTAPGFKLHVPSGYIGTDYINTTDNAVTSGVTGIMVKQGDNYLRTANAAAINTFLGITAPTGDNLGNHTATTILNMNNNYIDNTQGSSRFAQSNNTTTDYANAPIQVREAQYAGGLVAKAPRLSFHWAGVVASQIGLESSGRIAILNNPGTAYENLVASEIYSNQWFRNINSGTGLYNEANATGIFSPSAGIMAIYNNGSLGIGTTTPAQKLSVENGEIQLGEALGATGLGRKLYFSNAFNNSDDFFFQRENISSDYSNLQLLLGDNNSGDDKFLIKTVASATPLLTVVNNGNIGIGIPTPLSRLDVMGAKPGAGAGTGVSNNAPSQVIIPDGSGGGSYYNDWSAGWGGGLAVWDICGASAYFGGYITRSDRRLKKDIVSMDSDITKSFMQLHPVTYLLKKEMPETAGLQYGFIAQEVAELFPSIVTKDSGLEGATIGMNYQALIAPTVYIVQQQELKIQELTDKNNALQKQITEILELLKKN